MKAIDGDLDEQFDGGVMGDNTYFVADMHDLIIPNESARRIIANTENKIPTDNELVALYENCVDPLISAINDVTCLRKPNEFSTVISLGDMVANRINFGEGTERSIVGKLAKKAREKNVPQHEYLLAHIDENREALQEYAHRNNMWVRLRFEALQELLGKETSITFVHMNGNADVFSSLVGKAVLPDEKSPMEIFEESSAVERYYKELPGALVVSDSCGKDSFYLSIPQALDFNKSIDFLYKLIGFFEVYTRATEGSLAKINRDDVCLLIHEALKPDLCAKEQNVEGLETYVLASTIFSPKYIVHGHTHNARFIKYNFMGAYVTQIPPNELATSDEIFRCF